MGRRGGECPDGSMIVSTVLCSQGEKVNGPGRVGKEEYAESLPFQNLTEKAVHFSRGYWDGNVARLIHYVL